MLSVHDNKIVVRTSKEDLHDLAFSELRLSCTTRTENEGVSIHRGCA